MDIREKRNQTAKEILEGRFVKSVLSKESKELPKDLQKRIYKSGLSSEDWWSKVSFSVIGKNNLEYRHLKKHRFMDMKTRNTKEGKIRKKSYPIHNKMIYFHLNDIIRELTIGFTDTIINEMKSLENKENI